MVSKISAVVTEKGWQTWTVVMVGMAWETSTEVTVRA